MFTLVSFIFFMRSGVSTLLEVGAFPVGVAGFAFFFLYFYFPVEGTLVSSTIMGIMLAEGLTVDYLLVIYWRTRKMSSFAFMNIPEYHLCQVL